MITEHVEKITYVCDACGVAKDVELYVLLPSKHGKYPANWLIIEDISTKEEKHFCSACVTKYEIISTSVSSGTIISSRSKEQ